MLCDTTHTTPAPPPTKLKQGAGEGGGGEGGGGEGGGGEGGGGEGGEGLAVSQRAGCLRLSPPGVGGARAGGERSTAEWSSSCLLAYLSGVFG